MDRHSRAHRQPHRRGRKLAAVRLRVAQVRHRSPTHIRRLDRIPDPILPRRHADPNRENARRPRRPPVLIRPVTRSHIRIHQHSRHTALVVALPPLRILRATCSSRRPLASTASARSALPASFVDAIPSVPLAPICPRRPVIDHLQVRHRCPRGRRYCIFTNDSPHCVCPSKSPLPVTPYRKPAHPQQALVRPSKSLHPPPRHRQ